MNYLETLKKYFGYDSFRSIQLDIVKSIAEGHDTLGLMPTGGGKSITFQVPALTMEGVCLVITPLISLMKDQVIHLKQKGISAEAIYAELTHSEIQRILDNAIYGAVKFLYVSPERLSSELFLSKLYYMKLCFITVDEAHCISQWGYDFRPSYLKISDIREKKPGIPVLALTATATPQVVIDLQDKLRFGKYNDKEPRFFKMSFKRSNLSYVVRRAEDKIAEMIHILNSVNGCAIVYTRSRKKTKELANILKEYGFSATYYHAGLDFSIKDTHQIEWQNDKCRIICATNAFGMGIDKPDVRLVIHYDCPDSIEAYFQEAGRGGRDGKRSYAVQLFNNSERTKLLKHASEAFPPKEYIRKVYDHLAYFFGLAVNSGQGACFEFNQKIFCRDFNHSPSILEKALGILQNAGYLRYDPEPDSQPRIMFTVTRNELNEVNGLSELEERVVNALLRYSGSLFIELTFINEQYFCNNYKIDEKYLHPALIELSRKHILRYVPQKNVPTITYVQQRFDSEQLIFHKEIYEDLQERYLERINSILKYLECIDTCRSQILLEYFGEKDSQPCGCCDICLGSNKKDDVTLAVKKIKNFLSDGKPHPIASLLTLGLPKSLLDDAIEKLRYDEVIRLQNTNVIIHDATK